MIPVNIVTGFLGSGKTTLLREALQDPALSDSAVIVNEFGEIGLDHLLLKEIEEGVLLMESGCICCTIRSDLKFAIRDLQDRAARGQIPVFRRVILETTGLADPAPIVSTVLAEPVLRNHFRLGNIVCTVDAVNGSGQLDRQPESVKQALVADRLLITKCDLADEGGIRALSDRLAGLNPAAVQTRGCGSGFDIQALFSRDVGDEEHRLEEVRRWIAEPEPRNNGAVHAHGFRHPFVLSYLAGSHGVDRVRDLVDRAPARAWRECSSGQGNPQRPRFADASRGARRAACDAPAPSSRTLARSGPQFEDRVHHPGSASFAPESIACGIPRSRRWGDDGALVRKPL